jgi:hypothetical protein
MYFTDQWWYVPIQPLLRRLQKFSIPLVWMPFPALNCPAMKEENSLNGKISH